MCTPYFPAKNAHARKGCSTEIHDDTRSRAETGAESTSRSWRLPCTSRAAAAARHHLREHLAAWESAARGADIELLVSELATNAATHGRAPITLRVRTDDDGVRCELFDGAPEMGAPGAADDDEHGRGLVLVHAVASVWGHDTVPGGKVVWFELNW